MKYFRAQSILTVLTTAAACSLFLGCSGQPRSSSTDAATDGPAGWMSDTAPISEASATLTVQGLSCPKCANNVDLALAKVPGVRSAAIDMASGEVRVAFDESSAHPSRADLAKAIDRTGFTLTQIRVP